jgi:hypothetical protein
MVGEAVGTEDAGLRVGTVEGVLDGIREGAV